MLDLNDLSQLALADHQGWLARAAQFESRWPQARAQGIRCAEGMPAAPQAGIIWLALPTPLLGLGMVLQTLSAAFPQPLVLYAQPELAALPVPAIWLDPYGVVPPAQAGQGPPLVPVGIPELDAHPATHFLFWLSFLDQWLGRTLYPEAVRMPEERLQMLATWTLSTPVGENSTKQLAHALYERLPIFWAGETLAGVAYDWWQRYTRYAEAKAEWTVAAAVHHITAATRFPRYWPQAGLFVQLAQDQNDDTSGHKGLAQLFQRRRLASMSVPADLPGRAAAMLYLLEMGEWVALYAAALLGVDPADRVALDFLDSLIGRSGII
jgi:hypothetical protein